MEKNCFKTGIEINGSDLRWHFTSDCVQLTTQMSEIDSHLLGVSLYTYKLLNLKIFPRFVVSEGFYNKYFTPHSTHFWTSNGCPKLTIPPFQSSILITITHITPVKVLSWHNKWLSIKIISLSCVLNPLWGGMEQIHHCMGNDVHEESPL